DALNRARFGPGGTDPAHQAGGFASERSTVPLPFDPTPMPPSGGAAGVPGAGQTPPSNIRRDEVRYPDARAVPGRGMVAESAPPSPADFPLPFSVTGKA